MERVPSSSNPASPIDPIDRWVAVLTMNALHRSSSLARPAPEYEA